MQNQISKEIQLNVEELPREKQLEFLVYLLSSKIKSKSMRSTYNTAPPTTYYPEDLDPEDCYKNEYQTAAAV